MLACLLALSCARHADEDDLQAKPEHTAPLTFAEINNAINLEAEDRERRKMWREVYRKQGNVWFCEEGEWPQRWQEDCNTCWCEPGGVRSCTKAYCNWTGLPYPRAMCNNPEIKPPPYEPPPECRGPAAMGPMIECFDYFDPHPQPDVYLPPKKK